MKVLVIGDEHTYGYGLSGGKLSYIGHFIRQISRSGRAVSVEAYAQLTMAQIVSILNRLPLDRYDLMILQLDQRVLDAARSVRMDLACPPAPLLYPSALATRPLSWRTRFRTLTCTLRSWLRPSQAMVLSVLLKQLRPYRHRVLMITPLPRREPVSYWLRKRSRSILLDEADKQLFSVFDSDSVIRPGDEYFLTDDPTHLSAVSHELLGRSLYDFYESAPTIVTIQTTRRAD